MSLLSQVTKGKLVQPFLGLLFGVDGVGKSSFGAAMPAPIFIGAEAGTGNLNVTRFSATSFKEVLGVCKELLETSHPYQSLVIDSLDWLEPMCWEAVVQKYNAAAKTPIDSIEDMGYGKGYVLAIDEWRKLIAAMTLLREQKKMNIILIGHSQVKAAKDPTVQQDYDRYSLKLNEKAAALFREWVDCVFFANFETMTAADKKGKTRAFGDGARYIYTERRPAYDAKNRFGLPFQMALDWETLREALESANPEDPEVIIHNIKLLIDEVSTEVTKTKMKIALEGCKQDAAQLSRLLNKIQTVVNTQN